MLQNATWAKEALNNTIYTVHNNKVSTESSITKYEYKCLKSRQYKRQKKLNVVKETFIRRN
jgi:hypothetical protein